MAQALMGDSAREQPMARRLKVGRTGIAVIFATVILAMTGTLARATTPPLEAVADPRLAEEPTDVRDRNPLAPEPRVPIVRELPSLFPSGEAVPTAPTAPAGDGQSLTAKLALWVTFQDEDTDASFDSITRFIEANAKWPRLSLLRIRAERAIVPETPAEEVLRWFDAHEPRTGEGALAYAAALLRRGDEKRAITIIRDAWRHLDMKSELESEFLKRFGPYLEAEDHTARLDRLLWMRRLTAARRQMTRVGEGQRALAEAKLRLMRGRHGVDAALDRVPASLASDPGLAYERLRWHRRRDKDQAAVQILLAPVVDTPYPQRWWREREILARRLLAAGDAATAYRIVAEHGLSEGTARADAEFLAGWIALRSLDDAGTAHRHFAGLYDSVRYPISRARASYWAGRAAEAGGDASAAQNWYRIAASNVTTFYGQLAAHRLAEGPTTALPEQPSISPRARAAFDRDELVRAVRLLVALRDDPALKDRRSGGAVDPDLDPGGFLAGLEDKDALVPLLRHIARRSGTPEEWVLAAQLARETGRTETAVYVARRAARDGVVLEDLGYPVLSISDEMPPDPALVHALVRQESGFDPGARSRAGARGLMQLMPGTARRVARTLKLPNHSTERLTSDPDHNVLLGTTYLDSMLERFDGSMVMALAAYNAGPHRVDGWLEEHGDPRGSLDQTIDWIESIPFSETRNYVQRVLETLPIYRSKLAGGRVAVLQPEDLAGPPGGFTNSEMR